MWRERLDRIMNGETIESIYGSDDIVPLLKDVTLKVREIEKERNKLREAIRTHRNQKADDRCWLDDCLLYEAAGLPPGDNHIGDKFKMAKNCLNFIERRCVGGKWKSYSDLEEEIKEYREFLQSLGTPEAIDFIMKRSSHDRLPGTGDGETEQTQHP